MKLSELERQSAVWLRLDAHLNETLKSLRCRNDAELDALATARIRGEIAMCKKILSLGSQETVQPDGDD